MQDLFENNMHSGGGGGVQMERVSELKKKKQVKHKQVLGGTVGQVGDHCASAKRFLQLRI